jgi:hypothetical protein
MLIQWLSKVRREGEDLGIDGHIQGMAGFFLLLLGLAFRWWWFWSSTSVGIFWWCLGNFLKYI